MYRVYELGAACWLQKNKNQDSRLRILRGSENISLDFCSFEANMQLPVHKLYTHQCLHMHNLKPVPGLNQSTTPKPVTIKTAKRRVIRAEIEISKTCGSFGQNCFRRKEGIKTLQLKVFNIERSHQEKFR